MKTSPFYKIPRRKNKYRKSVLPSSSRWFVWTFIVLLIHAVISHLVWHFGF